MAWLMISTWLREPAPVVREARRRHHAVVGDGVARVVELHQEAGIDDHLVFGAHGIGDRGLQFVFALVEFVLAIGDHARRRRHRQEGFFHLHVFQRRLEVVDVALQFRLAGICDRADANRLGGGGNAFARIELGIEFREALAVGAALEWIGGVALDWPPLEAAQALQRVLRPTDRFAEFAVARNVDADLRLLAHHVGDALAQAFLISLRVVWLAGLLQPQKVLQCRRPDQAADMGGENAVAAALHGIAMPAPRAKGNAWANAAWAAAPRQPLATPISCSSRAGSLRSVSLGPS